MTVKNPWKKLSSEVVYHNSWISVREDQVITPSGSPGIYGVVETRVATGVVALTDDRKVFLVGQYRYPLDVYSWEIPEGGAEIDESPLEAAKRELSEEAGVTATDWQQLGGEVHVSNCYSAERALLYLARGISVGASAPDPTEELQVRIEPFDVCLQMVDSGEITDSLTIIALLRAARLIDAGRL
jgi:8-oxo-dGTP pyrophosphatase MutT (NUDIX family)